MAICENRAGIAVPFRPRREFTSNRGLLDVQSAALAHFKPYSRSASHAGSGHFRIRSRSGVAYLLDIEHEHELAVSVPGQAQVERSAPIRQREGARDRHLEPALGC